MRLSLRSLGSGLPRTLSALGSAHTAQVVQVQGQIMSGLSEPESMKAEASNSRGAEGSNLASTSDSVNGRQGPGEANAKKEAEAGGPAERRFKIYTKTGDGGESSLYSGERRGKDDAVFEALGDVDELNSGLGLASEFCRSAGFADTHLQIAEIQSRLLDVGSAVATPRSFSPARKVERVKFDSSSVQKLEHWIDAMDERLPPLRNFILPSGGLAASQLHVARSLCRRAERRVVPLVREEQVDEGVARFLNRLSDYLFTAARTAALLEGQTETIYKKSSPAS